LQYPELVGGAAAAARQGELVNELSGAVDELPPWIGQAKYMSPLLVAYEARIEEITQKNQEQMVRNNTQRGNRRNQEEEGSRRYLVHDSRASV
jgi:hypothetical protein